MRMLDIDFSRPFHGLRPEISLVPAMNRWAIVSRPLSADWHRRGFAQKVRCKKLISEPGAVATGSRRQKISLAKWSSHTRLDPVATAPGSDTACIPPLFVQSLLEVCARQSHAFRNIQKYERSGGLCPGHYASTRRASFKAAVASNLVESSRGILTSSGLRIRGISVHAMTTASQPFSVRSITNF
jgi:hypothetical protein